MSDPVDKLSQPSKSPSFTKLAFRPGVARDNTNYANAGGWYACDKVRFRSGFPEKIGGWIKYTTESFTGICRSLINWVTNNGTVYLGIGTNAKYYIENGGTIFDVTPLRKTSSLTDPFATQAAPNAKTIIVTDIANGALTGDYIVVSGVTSALNNVPASELNGTHQITRINDDTYSFTVTTAATSAGSGGGSVTIKYEIHPGTTVSSGGTGWGAGYWSRGGWGTASTTVVENNLRLWSVDNYGEDLFACIRDGDLYYWDAGGGVTSRLVSLSSVANDAPVIAKAVLVSEAERFAIAFGCNPYGTSTTSAQDPLLIRWSDQENILEWEPTGTNAAGDLRLAIGDQIIAVARTRQEILVFTSFTLHSLQFTGGDEVFKLSQLADNISIMGPNSAIEINNIIYWMGIDKFYRYSGTVQTLPCSLRQYVFTDINTSQRAQIFAAVNEQFGEITWYYCSTNSTSIDRYVVYNYLENVWYYGTLDRTAWLDSSLSLYPIAAGGDGYLYYHEYGTDDGSTEPPSAINAYIESSDFDIGNGDKFAFIRRLIPDINFNGSTNDPNFSPAVSITLAQRNYPGSGYTTPLVSTSTKSATVSVTEYSPQVFWIRMRGRQTNFRISSNVRGVQWQLGVPRIEIQMDGKR